MRRVMMIVWPNTGNLRWRSRPKHFPARCLVFYLGIGNRLLHFSGSWEQWKTE